MARAGKPQMKNVFLDTHAVLWLYDNKIDKFTFRSKKYLDSTPLWYSPIVYLELHYLYEIKKNRHLPLTILKALSNEIGLQSSTTSFYEIIQQATKILWTRDVFDRVITADAQVNNAPLITADKTIQKYYKKALI